MHSQNIAEYYRYSYSVSVWWGILQVGRILQWLMTSLELNNELDVLVELGDAHCSLSIKPVAIYIDIIYLSWNKLIILNCFKQE